MKLPHIMTSTLRLHAKTENANRNACRNATNYQEEYPGH